MDVPGGVIMAERKLRFDAAVTVVDSRPHIEMPELEDRLESVGLSSESPAPGMPPTPPHGEPPTELENAVRQKLASHPHVSISSLVVCEIPDGICLDGIIESTDDIPEVERLVRSVASVNRILNRLVGCQSNGPSG